MKETILEIKHPEFGIEKFTISEAKYNLYQTKDGIWEFIISFQTNSALNRSEDLVDIIHAEPNLEVAAILQADELEFKVGKKITQEKGYDYDRQEHLSNFYYAHHENVENFVLEIIEVKDNQLLAKGRGIAFVATKSVAPNTEIIFHNTIFYLDKDFKRTFS